jgi:hypothetical protein
MSICQRLVVKLSRNQQFGRQIAQPKKKKLHVWACGPTKLIVLYGVSPKFGSAQFTDFINVHIALVKMALA